MNNPPEGSKIQIHLESGFHRLIIPHSTGGIMRYLVAAFILFWLGGWAFGWFSAASELLKNKGQGPADLFLISWLGGWTVGGIFVFYFLFRVLRPSVPETIILSQPSITYDSGVAPFQFSFSFRSQMDVWKKLFQKRLRTEFDPIQIQTLKLREFDTGNRLTIDQGNKRLEVAAGASEPEREWLYELLKNEYKP
jgi:hypothetical protein